MTKAFKLILLTLVIATGFMACKKDSPVEENKEPQTLRLKGITYKNGIKIYTRNGEITDPQTIAKAIISTGMDLITHDPNAKDSLTFMKDNVAKFNNGNYVFEKNGDQFLFTSSNYELLSDDGISLQMINFYKFRGEIERMSYKRQFVAYGDRNSVKLSGLDICYLKRNEQTGKISNKVVLWLNNEFDINSLSQLGARDTLSIREYSQNYSR